MKRVRHFLHYLFVPSDKNNYRAKLIQHDLLSIYLCFILVLTIAIKQNSHLGRVGQVLGIATDVTIDQLFKDTNVERAKNGSRPLTYNTKLSAAAEQKAEDMFRQNYWAHFAPDGKTPWDFINGQGYKYEYAGENLAKNFLFSQNVVDAWMDSPSHRENLLRNDFTEVGFAVKNGVINGEETTLVVQMFGKPAEGQVAENSPPPMAQQQPPSGRVLSEVKAESIIRSAAPSTPSFPTLNFVYIFLGVLVTAFAIDFYVATRLKVVRLHGNSIAHMMFLLFMGAGVVFFLTKGAIL